MHLQAILFAVAVWAALITPAFPQLLGETSCGATKKGGPITIGFNPPPIRRWQAVTGGPLFSRTIPAVGSNSRRRHSLDHQSPRGDRGVARFSRAAAKRNTRRTGRKKPCNASMLMISDPVAGYVYLLDPLDQVAYRLAITVEPPIPAKEVPTAQKPASTSGQTPPGEPAISTESLGEKTMFGITVTGTLRTLTYPVDSRIGNDRPVTTTEEHWVSPQLGLIVSSHDADPSGRVNTFTRRGLRVAEPDPSLFKSHPDTRSSTRTAR